ncbi:MAG: VOC family protein [Nibricoccus sp.]
MHSSDHLPLLESIPVGTVLSAERGKLLPPSQRLHLIVLGVRDIAKSAAFYEALGWKRSPTGHDGFVKFNLGGYALCLLPYADLAKDVGADPAAAVGFSGVAFVHLVKSLGEVALVLERAVAAGGTLVKPATRTPWGVAGYFRDPDGYLFEVDYEQCWVFDEEGRLVVDSLN